MGLDSLAEFKSSAERKRPQLLRDYRLLLMEIISGDSGMTLEQKSLLEGLMTALDLSIEDVMAQATALDRSKELRAIVEEAQSPEFQQQLKAAGIAVAEYQEVCRCKIGEMKVESERLALAKSAADQRAAHAERARNELASIRSRFPDLIEA